MGGNEGAALNEQVLDIDDEVADGGEETSPLINRIDMRDMPARPRGDVAPARYTDAGTTRHESVTVDGIERDYWVHLPKNYDPSQKLPLVLVFNGYASSGRQLGDVAPGGAGMEELTGLSKKADEEGFIVAYMDGNPDDHHSWNNGQWWFSKRDDVKYTGRVIDKLQENYGTDPSRVYLAGFSQGASFVHRAVAEMPDRIAAVADVSGWMSGKEKRTAAGIPVIALQSVDDETVPYEGRKWWLTMKPEIHTSRHYRDINNIETVTPKVHVHHQQDGRMIKDRTYTDPATGVEIRTILVEKEGHVWFGGKGAENSQINASNLVWDFFKRHQKGNAGGERGPVEEPPP